MKIAVAGAGYVGLSLGLYMSEKHNVYVYDIDEQRVNKINKKISLFKDDYIDMFLQKNKNLVATTDYVEAFKKSDFIVIATPTNYDENTNSFDTSNVEDIIKKVKYLNLDSTIIIKSTVPIGFTDKMREKYNKEDIYFSPEFLREGNALHDCFYASRIIVGSDSQKARTFADILKESNLNKNPQVIFTNSREAEAIKLFSNTYLALRVAFFNELDTFCEVNGISSKKVINGVCSDSRIGNYYNNPSFGYGGYCLPKDSKQLYSNFLECDIESDIIKSVIDSNETRKNHIVEMLLKKGNKTIGIYKLEMKKDSDNHRQSSILDIVKKLKEKNIDVIIFDQSINEDEFYGCRVLNNLEDFINESDVIATNRLDRDISNYKEKVYTRDIFNKD